MNLRVPGSVLLWEPYPRELHHTATLYQLKPYLQAKAIKTSNHLDWGRLRVVSKITPFLRSFNIESNGK